MEENFSLLYNVKHTHTRTLVKTFYSSSFARNALSLHSLSVSLSVFSSALFQSECQRKTAGNTQPNATNVRRTKERKNRRPFVPSLFRVSNPKRAKKFFNTKPLFCSCVVEIMHSLKRERMQHLNKAQSAARENTPHI